MPSTDLLQSGVAWLTDQLATNLCHRLNGTVAPGTLMRGAQSQPMPVTLGKKLLRVVDGAGQTRIEVTDADLLVKAMLHTLGGNRTEPQRGDRWIIPFDDGDRLMEVLPYGDEPPFRWSDPNQTLLRIHTKGIAFPAPTVAGVSPPSGNTSAPTPVTITGTGYRTNGTTAVTVGSLAATAVVVVNATTITCTFPAAGAGTVNVTVTNPDGQSGTLVGGFTRNAPPVPTSVTDPMGLAGGGISVTVTGTGFQTSGTTGVTFGGTAATGVSVSSSTSLTCAVPAHAAGLVNVVVTNPDSQTGTLTNGFTFLPAGVSIWFRADKGTFQNAALTTPATADGDPVGGWQDQSGNGNHATQGTAGKRPLLKLNVQNGLPVLRWDGSDDFLQLASVLPQGNFTVLLAVKPGGDNALVGSSVASNPQVRVGRGGSNVLSTNDGAVDAISSTLGVGVGNWMLAEFGHSGTVVSFFQNGTAFGTGSFTATVSPQFNQLGIFGGASLSLNGDLLEILYYPTALSTGDRQIVETYLRNRGALY